MALMDLKLAGMMEVTHGELELITYRGEFFRDW